MKATTRPATTSSASAPRTIAPHGVPLFCERPAPASVVAESGRRLLRRLVGFERSFVFAVDALGSLKVAAWDPAGAIAGVGSNGTQPMPSNHTSIHECASRSRTTYSLRLRS